jgi:hypothetical protein
MHTKPPSQLVIAMLVATSTAACGPTSPSTHRVSPDASDAQSIDGNTDGPELQLDAGSPLARLGATCSSSSDCQSGACVDGVCCGSAACGTCQSCAVAGSLGTCAPVPRNTVDVDSACTGVQACDGAGHCLTVTGQLCGGSEDCLSGFCTDGVCCATACDQQCYACHQPGTAGMCTPIGAVEDSNATVPCAGSNICVISTNGVPACKLKDGQACRVDGDCAAAHCRTYYRDGDGDGYGATTASLSRCDANVNAPAGYVNTGGDCCDSDPHANPGVTTPSIHPDACGSYDWNCKNGAEPQMGLCPGAGTPGAYSVACGVNCTWTTGVLWTQSCL